jgi:hypothetical protein
MVRVMWETPRRQTGIHKVTDLEVVDRAPTQQELAMMMTPPENPRGKES